MAARYSLYAVKIGSTVFPGVGEQTKSPGIGVVGETSDGVADLSFVAKAVANPRLTFGSVNIAGLIGELGLRGADITGITGGIVLYWAQRGTVGAASGTVHLVETITTGLAVPVSLNAPHGGVADISYEIIPTSSDGTTDPVVRTTAALAAIAAPLETRFTCGKVKVGSSFLTNVKNIGITWNNTINEDSDSGLPYRQFAALESQTVQINVGHSSPSYIPGDFATTLVYLRQLKAAGFPYADADENHLMLTVAAGTLVENDTAATTFRAESGLTIHARQTGSTAVLQYAADEAID